MNSNTLPYIINLQYLSIYWKTEHTSNYISKEHHKFLNKPLHNSTQINISFSQYKNHN